MITKNYDARSRATQTWLLLEFYENLVFLTTQSVLYPNLLEKFLFKINRQGPKSNFKPKICLKQIGAECTPGCQKYQIFIKF